MEQHNKPKDWNDVLIMFKEFPELGAAFYSHYEAKRDELIAAPWYRVDKFFDRKCQIAAQFIQSEILDPSGLKDLTRK
jgi:hypothetical protein